ncbi:MAG: T9SS type A sorting domain-containing protein, partial [Bacteroidales bacterium]|nr:T9SS type A sorting domain-containing protein [Bacteroidales bacterium]
SDGLSAAAGDSDTGNQETYTESGDYVQTFQNALGCDSVVTLHLTINESETYEFTATACEEYTWNNETYTESGDYVQSFQNALGCDSIVTLHLTINYSETYEFTATACDEYTWNNEIYTTSGDYVQTFQNALGCDSIVTLHLTINYSETYEFSATACEEYTWNNETYTESGDYVQSFQNAFGCDSVVTLHLMINKPEIIEVNGSLTICKDSWTTLEVESSYANSFVWTVPDNFEMVQTESPNVIWLKGLEAGSAEISVYGINDECGNSEVYNFDITIAPTYHEYYEVEACQGGSYSGYGFNDLTMEGVYSQSYTSVDGCDSIVTLSLQFVESESQTIAVTACNSYVWNNEVLTTSGIWSQTLTNVNGCDSIVTLYLTLYHDVSIEMEQTVCDSYTWNNETYTESGDYVQNFTTSAGCDSVVTLHLTIVPSYETNVEASICFGDYYNFFGVMLNESGQYEHALNALNGCDSTIILTLIVNELPDVQIEGEIMIHLGESATLTATGAETYQWSTGETTEEIIVTPTYTRTYNVIGTDGNGCSNRASHVVEVTLGIETVNADSFKVYPNPTQQRVTIEGDHMQQIELYNALGQRVHWMNLLESESSVELNVERYETGSYLIRITTVDGKTLTKRLIIAR